MSRQTFASRYAQRQRSKARLTQHALIVVCAFAAALGPSVAYGQASDFVIDPAQSYITLSGTVNYLGSHFLTEQFPGSLTTNLAGDIFADTESPSSILFFSSAIQLADQLLPAQPGGIAAQFGANVLNFPSSGVTSAIAFQNVGLASSLNIAQRSGDSFIASQLSFSFPSTAIAHIKAPGAFVGDSAVTPSGPNTGDAGLLQPEGAGMRMTIPFSFAGTILNTNLQFTGQIVAHSTGQSVTPPGAPIPWPIASGGNGHYYAVVNSGYNLPWATAEAQAASLTYAGLHGHLATINSQAENDFISGAFGDAIRGTWLGGFQPPGSAEPAGGWQWITGEPFAFTNWEATEPNNSGGNENALAFATASAHAPGVWNDLNGETPPVTFVDGYVVEFESVPEPSTLALSILGAAALLAYHRWIRFVSAPERSSWPSPRTAQAMARAARPARRSYLPIQWPMT